MKKTLSYENGIEAWEEKALAVFGPIADSGVYPDDPDNPYNPPENPMNQLDD